MQLKQIRKVNKIIKKLRYRQEEAVQKALTQKLFFLLAKCRFGKTPTAISILNGWDTKTAVVVSGIAVREGWQADLAAWGNFDIIIDTNDKLMEMITNIVANPNYYDDKSVAIFVMTQKLYHDYADAVETDCVMALADWFNKRLGNKALVFDEAHQAEQAALTKQIVGQFEPTHKIYITATAWTKSLQENITDENSYAYGLKEEYNDFINGLLDYKYIKLLMYCLDKTFSIVDDTEEGWANLFSDQDKSIDFLTKALAKLLSILDSHKEKNRNIILYTRTQTEGAMVDKCLKLIKTVCGINIHTKAAYGSNHLSQTDACAFYQKHAGDLNIVISCNRLGTGVTIPELNTTMFCCPTKSAIKFVQYSMRGISQLEDNSKDQAYVFCFNRFGAYEVYSRLCKELDTGKKKHVNPGNFRQMQNILPFYCEDTSDLKQVEFIDIAEYNEQYAKGQRLFTEFDALDSFIGFNIFVSQIKQIKAKVSSAAQQAGMSVAAAEALADALVETAANATTATEFKTAIKQIRDKTGVKISGDDKDALDIAKTRKLLEATFIRNVEMATYDGNVIITETKEAEYNEDTLYNIYFSLNMTREFFDNIMNEYSDYIKKIANTIIVREAI